MSAPPSRSAILGAIVAIGVAFTAICTVICAATDGPWLTPLIGGSIGTALAGGYFLLLAWAAGDLS